MDAKETELK
jgi:chromosome segregation ATPase